jgi:hypothetical protein
LTPFELKQPDSVFLSAGKHAYMIGIYLQDNPYRTNPYHMLWERGYRFAKKKFEPAHFTAFKGRKT